MSGAFEKRAPTFGNRNSVASHPCMFYKMNPSISHVVTVISFHACFVTIGVTLIKEGWCSLFLKKGAADFLRYVSTLLRSVNILLRL